MENWRQIFGCNQLLWFFPVSWASGHPVGDGVYWVTNQNVLNSQRNNSAGNNRKESERKENTENNRLIMKNDSHQSDSENRSMPQNQNENKENINNQSHSHSSGTHLKYDPDQFNANYGQIDTVVNRKDDNNTLIVHSQDKNKMLKNTLIKK